MTPFIKMHALGNDFVLIHKADLPNNNVEVYNTNYQTDNYDDRIFYDMYASFKPPFIKTLSDRKTGIGFDQAIIIDDFNSNSHYFTITFVNADGSHAGGCGNGTRAAAGYFHQQTSKTEFDIHITLPSGGVDVVHAHILRDNLVTIKMPSPRFDASQIPLSDITLNPQKLMTPHLNHVGFCVNVGNPHYVMIIDNPDDFYNFALETVGHTIEHDPLFPQRINFEIIFIQNKTTLKMRVWERGTGITNACGTGACASVIAAVTQGLTDEKVTVIMDGGALDIEYNPQANDLFMTGGYTFVFKGELL